MIRTYTTEGIVLKRRNSGEADRVLTVYTQKNGKITLKAVGVRRITSRRSSHIELLNISVLTLYKGRGAPILIEAQTKSDFSCIKEDLQKVGFAYHLCELVDGLCPENQENERVFHLLSNALRRLNQEDDLLSVIHEFEINLLKTLGFWSTSLSTSFDTHHYIENILERKLRSKSFFSKIQ